MTEENAFSPSSPPMQAGAKLGRFELRRMLGQGGQSSVWLAFDPRMEREVAIKLMRPGAGTDDQAIAQWLQEARSVGRVNHPNIVQVFEADIQGQQPYLVFEYVAGQTLEQVLRERGIPPVPQSVTWMVDVLDAVATAHAAGVVHRDLKPSNVLIDSAGRARVMDFGIAARIRDSHSSEPALAGGTIGYLSPEATDGLPPSPSMDIFSAGLVLAELLLGRRLIAEIDPYRALYRVMHEQLLLPDDPLPGVDDHLRAIVNRALAHDARQRFVGARVFQSELEQWSQSAAGGAVPAAGTTSSSDTLEFLMRRMRHRSDFPAMSDSVVRIQSMAASETESVGSVTNEILKDVALTNKLLRLVNSAHYGRSGSGSISTVSRAVTLVGFNGIRNMALSLVLLEHMQDKAHAAQLKEEFLRSLLAGSIGGELCSVVRESEEAFIGAMFQNLGRLLVLFYFPEEASRVRGLMQDPRRPLSEISAAISVLGLSFEALGLGIARAWSLPEDIQRCMRKPAGEPPQRAPADSAERVRWVALASNEMADVLLHSDPQEREARLAVVTRKYMLVMGVSAKEVMAATSKARLKLVDLAAAMEIRVAPGSAADKLLKPGDPPVELLRPAPAEAESHFGSLELQATPTVGAAQIASLRARQVAETLAAGIQDITNAMVEDFKLSDVLRMILETMYRAMEFDRIIFCMRDSKTEMMVGRFGLGEGVERCVKVFKTHLKAPTPDLFGVVSVKGADTMISDASEARIVQRLPDWYRMTINAPTFLLLPLQIKGAPFGLIYADKTVRGALELDDKELALLRTLRNQAVMAFKQSS
ncbi:MAG: HDOD domain-containing protein [Rhodoferax sp.]|nr:HDOD domain-containing protein [Rhodoferax sp.]